MARHKQHYQQDDEEDQRPNIPTLPEIMAMFESFSPERQQMHQAQLQQVLANVAREQALTGDLGSQAELRKSQTEKLDTADLQNQIQLFSMGHSMYDSMSPNKQARQKFVEQFGKHIPGLVEKHQQFVRTHPDAPGEFPEFDPKGRPILNPEDPVVPSAIPQDKYKTSSGDLMKAFSGAYGKETENEDPAISQAKYQLQSITPFSQY